MCLCTFPRDMKDLEEVGSTASYPMGCCSMAIHHIVPEGIALQELIL